MKNAMSIRPLPDEVVAQIKSSTAIVSLAGVVLELLKNSLDAKASRIHVTVDFVRGGCTIEDDGLGIEPTEFREDGGLGKLYCMCILCSKCVDLHTNKHTSYLEVSISRTTSRSAWHISRLAFGHVSIDHHFTSPRIPLAQLDLVSPRASYSEADTDCCPQSHSWQAWHPGHSPESVWEHASTCETTIDGHGSTYRTSSIM